MNHIELLSVNSIIQRKVRDVMPRQIKGKHMASCHINHIELKKSHDMMPCVIQHGKRRIQCLKKLKTLKIDGEAKA